MCCEIYGQLVSYCSSVACLPKTPRSVHQSRRENEVRRFRSRKVRQIQDNSGVDSSWHNLWLKDWSFWRLSNISCICQNNKIVTRNRKWQRDWFWFLRNIVCILPALYFPRLLHGFVTFGTQDTADVWINNYSASKASLDCKLSRHSKVLCWSFNPWWRCSYRGWRSRGCLHCICFRWGCSTSHG